MPIFEFANADGIPSFHPERRGKLSRVPGKNNWIEKTGTGNLPTYINSIATALKRENPSWSISRVIATAVNAVKKMCSTGKAFNGKAKVSKAVQTAACNAVASWNAKKAGASEGHFGDETYDLDDDMTYDMADSVSTKPWSNFKESDYTDEQFIRACLIKGETKSDSKFPVREPDGTLNKNAIHAAAARIGSAKLSSEQMASLKSKLRGLYKKIGETPPDSLSMSDEAYMTEVLELDSDEIQKVGEILDGEKYMQILEASAAEQCSLRLPVYELDGSASETSDGLMEKEILRVGSITHKGNKVHFSEEDLKAAEENFNKNALDYVPFQLATDDNKHSDSPSLYGGTVEKLRRSEDGKKLIGSFRLTDEVKEIVKHNPKFGVSVKLHPNYYREADEQHFGPTLMHVAGVHRPKITGMSPWQSIAASIEDDDELTINLAEEGEYDEEEVVEQAVEEEETQAVEENNEQTTDEGGIKIMAENGETQTITNDQLKSMITDAVNGAVSSYKTENEELQNRIASLSDSIENGNEKAYKQAVKGATDKYKNEGVPPAMVELAESLMLSFAKEERNTTIELSEDSEGNKENVSRVELITRLLDNAKGYVNLSEETGSSEDGAEFTDDDDAAVDFLMGR